ncbi:MAG: hypothetical protein KA758_15605 [Acidimicrobiales bacterium]|nr:hypothetical protein [Acidimicrobiales bacterium]
MTLTARPTTYKGTLMRSRLEAGYAAWLDHVGFDWSYEAHCYAGPGGQWLPDFTIHQVYDVLTRTLCTAHVEVKPEFTQDVADEYHRRTAGVPQGDLVLIQTPRRQADTVSVRGSTGWVSGRWSLIAAPSGFPCMVLTVKPKPSNCPWPDEWWKGPAT